MDNRLTAAIYARFSSDSQRSESIDDQFRICREYCAAHDLTVAREYHDDAISGLTDNRPDFQRMIKDGEHHAFDVLVLYAVDRFSRNKYDAAIYKARLKKAGVQIVYVTSPIGEGPESILVEGLLESLAQYYSENLSRSIRRGLTGNALRGVWTSNKVPLGYLLTETKGLKIDHSAASVVHRIFELYAAGSSCNDIAKRMNREGHRSALGKPFNSSIIINILKNKIYIGTYTYCDIVNENAVDPIIDEPLFDAVQQKLETLYKSRGHNKAADPYLLTTKLYCGACGRWLVGDGTKDAKGRRYNYYVCPGVIRGNKDCQTRRIRKDRLEHLVLNVCRETLTDERIIDIAEAAAARFAADAAASKEIARYEKQLADIERKINNLIKAIESGVINNTVSSRLNALEDDRAAVSAALQLARVPQPILSAAEIAYYLKSIRDSKPDDPNYKQFVINNLLNSVTLYDLPDGTRKLAVAFNLSTDANREIITGADFMDIGGLTYLNYKYPKFAIIKHCICTVIDIAK